MTEKQHPNKSILYGFISLAAGIAFIYFFIWRSLEAMAMKKEDITYSLKGVGLGPFLIVLGLYFLVVRPRSLKPAEMSRMDLIIYWCMIGVAIVLGIVAFVWFKRSAEQLGYTV